MLQRLHIIVFHQIAADAVLDQLVVTAVFGGDNRAARQHAFNQVESEPLTAAAGNAERARPLVVLQIERITQQTNMGLHVQLFYEMFQIVFFGAVAGNQ